MKMLCICCAYCDCTTGCQCYFPSTLFGCGLVCPNLPGCGICQMDPADRKHWLKKKPFKRTNRDKADTDGDAKAVSGKAKDKGKIGKPAADNPFHAGGGSDPTLSIHDVDPQLAAAAGNAAGKAAGKMSKKDKKAAKDAVAAAARDKASSDWAALQRPNQ